MNSNRLARVKGRTLLVASVGVYGSWISFRDIDWAMHASQHECQALAAENQLCPGITPPGGMVNGIVLLLVASWIVTAIATSRPLRLTGPTAVMVIVLAGVTWPTAGGRPDPVLAFGFAAGWVLAVVGAAVAPAVRSRQRRKAVTSAPPASAAPHLFGDSAGSGTPGWF